MSGVDVPELQDLVITEQDAAGRRPAAAAVRRS